MTYTMPEQQPVPTAGVPPRQEPGPAELKRWKLFAVLALVLGLLAGAGAGFFVGNRQVSDLKDDKSALSAELSATRGDLTRTQGDLTELQALVDEAVAVAETCDPAYTAASSLGDLMTRVIAQENAYNAAPVGSAAEAAAEAELEKLYPQVEPALTAMTSGIAACDAAMNEIG
jgi:hypothetical protein